MRQVMFWNESDTVVNSHRPIDTYEIVKAVVNRGDRVWIELQHLHTKEIVKGWEAELQQAGYCGYRKPQFIET